MPVKLGILVKRKVGYMELRKKRKIVSVFMTTLLLILAIIFSSGCTALGSKTEIPIPNVQKDVFVYDQDDIIDDDIEQKLNQLLIQLESQTTAEVAVVTTKSLLGISIEDYSYYLANTLGIGKAGEDNGVLLLISKSDNKVRLEIGKGLEGCLNDSKCGRILDFYFVPYRENDEYSEGTYQTIQVVAAVIAQEYNTTLDEIEKDFNQELIDKEHEQEIRNIITFIIVIIVIFILFVCDNVYWDGALFSAILSSSSSGGGFGGGSFGGGGASR